MLIVTSQAIVRTVKESQSRIVDGAATDAITSSVPGNMRDTNRRVTAVDSNEDI